MDVEFLTGIAVIAPEASASRRLYVEALGLPLEATGASDYHHSERIPGCRHFGVWSLAEAAQACFGTAEWPAERPVPQASVEFDVADRAAVEAAAQELRGKGYELLHYAREEPWGQTVARLQGPEGVIVGVTHTPALR